MYADLSWLHAPSGFSTGLEARITSKVYVDDANSDATDSYSVLNWHAGIRRTFGEWTMRGFVRIDNLTDEDYVGSVVVNAANDRFFEPAPGRTYYVGLSVGF